MGKFEQEAKDLLAAIGGKENVTAVTHCATRMRFVLGDDKKADVKTIEQELVQSYQGLKVFLRKLLNQLLRATKTQFSVL